MVTKNMRKNGGLYGVLAAGAVVFGAWQVGEAANARAGKLPVLPPPRPQTEPGIASTKDYYSVWVKRVPQAGSGADSVDRAFAGAPPAPAAAASVMQGPAVDVAAVVRSGLLQRLTGSSDRGIFLGGEFVAVGDKVNALTVIDGQGRAFTPILSNAGLKEVTLVVGKQALTLRVTTEL